MKYYKPSSSRLLYLNTSFNCIKSNSITITKVLSGTGYTSNPIIVITPAKGDLGQGASATITQSGGILGTLTTVSTGRGYNTLPTITLSGGGNPGSITGFSALVGGSGYILPPTITTSGGGGTGFSATALIGDVVISSTFTITTAGTGYVVGDVIVFSGGGGSGAVATVSSVSSGGITGISLTNAGSGYTSAPTISVLSTAGINAVITCALVGASVIGITINNGGKNFATAPTFVFTPVSGGTGASATPTLVLGTEGTFTVAFTRTFTYSWDIPDIGINDLGRLSVVNIMGNSTASTPYIFRIIGLQYDSKNCFFSDYGNPIISMSQQTNSFSSYGSTGENKYSLVLSPQTIRIIQISVDDSLTTKDVGIVSTINFIIAIEIEEFDPVLTQIGDPYQESASRLKFQY